MTDERQTKYESIDHFIKAHSKPCTECDELRVNYELDADGVCLYCKARSHDGTLKGE